MSLQIAEKLLQEAKIILPMTDSGSVNYITEGEFGYGSLHTRAEAVEINSKIKGEEDAIKKMLNILSIQARYETSQEIIDEFYDMVKVLFDDCCDKGYSESAESILRIIAVGALDKCEKFDKQKFIKEGISNILNICGKSQIITRKMKYKQKALNIIVKTRQSYFGDTDYSISELIKIYNGVEMGSFKVKNKITEQDLQEYQGY